MVRPVRRSRRDEDDELYDSGVSPLDEDDDDEDEGDERPVRRSSHRRPPNHQDSRRPGTIRRTGRVSKGWEAVEKVAADLGGAQYLKIDDGDSVIVKFLQPDPFAVFHAHWVNGRTYTGLDDDCPLCSAGDRPKTYILFNVLDVASRKVLVWRTGVRSAQTLAAFAQKRRTAPIDRDDLYWEIQRTGKGTKTQYQIVPVPADAVEDEGLGLVDPGELAKLRDQVYDEAILFFNTREELEDLVDELTA